MISQQKKHKRITPMPVVSSFPPPDRSVVYKKATTRPMTAEEWAKWGPVNPARRNKKHYLKGKSKA